LEFIDLSIIGSKVSVVKKWKIGFFICRTGTIALIHEVAAIETVTAADSPNYDYSILLLGSFGGNFLDKFFFLAFFNNFQHSTLQLTIWISIFQCHIQSAIIVLEYATWQKRMQMLWL